MRNVLTVAVFALFLLAIGCTFTGTPMPQPIPAPAATPTPTVTPTPIAKVSVQVESGSISRIDDKRFPNIPPNSQVEATIRFFLKAEEPIYVREIKVSANGARILSRSTYLGREPLAFPWWIPAGQDVPMEIRVRLSIDKPTDPQDIHMWVEEIRWSYRHNDLQTYAEIRNLKSLEVPKPPPRSQGTGDGVLR